MFLWPNRSPMLNVYCKYCNGRQQAWSKRTRSRAYSCRCLFEGVVRMVGVNSYTRNSRLKEYSPLKMSRTEVSSPRGLNEESWQGASVVGSKSATTNKIIRSGTFIGHNGVEQTQVGRSKHRVEGAVFDEPHSRSPGCVSVLSARHGLTPQDCANCTTFRFCRCALDRIPKVNRDGTSGC
jgi:hypothetical protein